MAEASLGGGSLEQAGGRFTLPEARKQSWWVQMDPGCGRLAGWEKGSFLSCDDALSPERSEAGSGVKSTE